MTPRSDIGKNKWRWQNSNCKHKKRKTVGGCKQNCR